MEANFGGPVWHASAAPTLYGWSEGDLFDRAHEALIGVGDGIRGQWTEWTGRAFHIRRRLSAAEDLIVGPVVDIRGSYEARKRLGQIERFLPAGFVGGPIWNHEFGGGRT